MTGPTGQNDVLPKMGFLFGNIKKILNLEENFVKILQTP
jgi:hypothetical protein